MKNLFLLLLVIATLTSCNNDDDTPTISVGIVGTWQLRAVYLDPGDGSGTFQTVNSDREFEFFQNGTLVSNYSLCSMSGQTVSNNNNTGTYIEATGEINTPNCGDNIAIRNYQLIDNELIINYFCIEACQEKYEKIE